MAAPTLTSPSLKDFAYRHPGTLMLGAVAAGAVAGWFARGRLPGRPGGGTYGVSGTHVSDADRDRAVRMDGPTVPEPREPVTPRAATEPKHAREVVPEEMTATPPPPVRGSNVADQGWNTGPTRRGAT